jgi:hypothetical protein
VQEAISDPRFVAILPFRWLVMQSGLGSPPPAPPFKKVQQRFNQIARWITQPGKTDVFPVRYDVSGIAPGTEACYAFDEDNTTGWNSGGFAPQAVLMYLPGNTHVRQIVLNPGSFPATTSAQFQIWGKAPAGSWISLASYNGYITDRQLLPAFTGTWDVSQIQINSTQGGSWVAWLEIQVSR